MSEKIEKAITTHREPLIHITKRDAMEWWKSWLIRFGAIFAALVVSGIIITLLSGLNPIDVYVEMVKGNFETKRKMWVTFQRVAVLLCISLAVTPAFKMKFWNCGAEGQTLAGCLSAAACMIYFGNTLPMWAYIPVLLICSVLAGAIWGVIPAIFKAHYNTNETLFTLMMNYVAISLVKFFEIIWENPNSS